MTDLCIHVANIFYLISFLNRDMLWLRVLTCIGLVFGIIFFTTCATPMYGPAGWHLVFLCINVYQIYRLIDERRQTDLPFLQERVGTAAVADLSRETLLNMLAFNLSHPGRGDDFRPTKSQLLDGDALVLKQLVLDRLSRREIVNLLTRRMWQQIRTRFKRRKKLRAAQEG